MNCKEKDNKLDICFSGYEVYKYPIPVVLDTFLFVNDIVDINENKNRISPTRADGSHLTLGVQFSK